MATPNLNDQALLGAEPGFQGRVKQALAQICFDVSSETVTGLTGNMPSQLHELRAQLASRVLNNIAGSAGIPNYQTFAIGAATDPTTIAAATASANLTAATVAAAAAAIPDADIVNAISAQFNAYLTL